MAKNNNPKADAVELRPQAEEHLKERQKSKKSDGGVPGATEEAQRLIQELQIHQIELEMQNEELRRTHAELEASRARYLYLYDLAPAGYCTLSEAGLILEVNLAAATLLGAARAALIRQPLPRFILPGDQDIYYRHHRLLFETGAPQVCELRLVKKDATPFWVRIDATAAQDADGTPLCRATMIDITERKREDEWIAHLAAMVDLAPSAIMVHDFAGRLLYTNQKNLDLHGYSREELMALNLCDIDVPSRTALIEERMNVIRDGGEASFEVEHYCKDGTTLPLELFVKLVDWCGKPALLSLGKDIRERKLAEEALQTNEERYRALVENAKDFVYRMDGAGHFTYVNPSGLRILGYKEEELIGKDYSTLIRPDMRDDAIKFFGRQFVKGSKNTYSEYPVLTKEGNEVWLGQNTELIVKDGQAIGFQAISRDITERKHAEEKLQQTLESLRKAVGTTIQVLAYTVETRDPYTAGHQTRSADLARAIGTEMELPQEKIDAIRIAGSIHDIGKLAIPAEILSKPTKLSEIEFALIKEHSRKGYEMLKDVESPWPLAEIVYQHHERMDGSGYPRNLKGDEILIEARILAVSDVVESMASHRPYRPALGVDAALVEIEKNRGICYDDVVADVCLRLFREKGFQLQEA